MSVPSLKSKVTCERPNFVSERISRIPGRPAISISIGRVTSFSDSSAASAGTSVLICTWTPVMSGTASIGKFSADHKPPASSATAANRTIARWRRENSRMRSIMASRIWRFVRRRRLDRVELKPGEQLDLLSGFECFAPRVEQCLDRFEVLLLQLDVSGNRHCAEPVMTVGQFRRLAKLVHGFGPPVAHLGQFCLIRQRRLDDATVKVALSPEGQCFSLRPPRFRCLDIAFVPIPQRQWQRDADADLLLAITRALLRIIRPDSERRVTLLTSQGNFEPLLLQFDPSHEQLEIVRSPPRRTRRFCWRQRTTA